MNERDKKNDDVEKIGDHVAKKKSEDTQFFIDIFSIVILVYGAAVFLDPNKYQLLGRFSEKLAQYDVYTGFIILIAGVYLLFVRKR